VANLDDKYDEFTILNVAKNAVIAYSITPQSEFIST